MASPVLEPLGIGEQLDAGFRLWRPRFGKLYLISLAITLPVAIVSFIWQATNIVEVDSLGVTYVEDPDTYNAVMATLGIVSLVASVITVGALLVMVTRAYEGMDRSVGDVFRESMRRMLPFLGLTILVGIIALAGFVVLIVPGIILSVSLSLAFPAFWAERTNAAESIGRSWTLIRGRRWHVFGLAVVTIFFSFIFSVVLGFISVATLFRSEVIVYSFVSSIIGTLWSAAIAPLVPIMVTVAYYDCRVRNEGFDLELAERMLDDTSGREIPRGFSPE